MAAIGSVKSNQQVGFGSDRPLPRKRSNSQSKMMATPIDDDAQNSKRKIRPGETRVRLADPRDGGQLHLGTARYLGPLDGTDQADQKVRRIGFKKSFENSFA